MDDKSLNVKKKIQSSIPELSVGDERKCFNQIRKASEYIRPDSLLWNGWPAGQFALSYVIGHHTKRKKKQEERQNNDGPKKKKKFVYGDEDYVQKDNVDIASDVKIKNKAKNENESVKINNKSKSKNKRSSMIL